MRAWSASAVPTVDSAASARIPDWLAALSHPAAVIEVRGEMLALAHANATFTTAFPGIAPTLDAKALDAACGAVAGAYGIANPGDARARVYEFAMGERATSSFDVQRDGALGPETFTCALSRLDDAPDGAGRILLTCLDRTSQRHAENNFRRELMSDSLTALPNRSGFGEEIEDRLAAAELDRGAAPSFAILVIDLVRFSRINESLGGLTGDEVIISVARRLKGALRQGDILARIGGNEFAIFARLNNGVSDALQIAERARDALAAPIRLTNLQIRVDCATGCALSGHGETDPEAILRQAQAAVKLAKRSGKLEIYRPGVLKEARRRFDLETRLRVALDQNALALAYQPIVDLASGEIAGFEALARWHDDELGEVVPNEFIPVAEECGLIVPLGRWAMHEAAQTLAAWDRRHGGIVPVGMNVNLSPIQMSRDDVPSVVQEALRHSGIAGSRLTIELTESAIIADPDKARQVLNALKGLDAAIAMDDFGTGYSNLASLQTLPIDILKIDRSFVSGMIEDHDKDAIVRAIISMADALGLRVTAEGIESEALVRVLAALGCGSGQGYHYAPPMTAADAFAYWSARWNFETV